MVVVQEAYCELERMRLQKTQKSNQKAVLKRGNSLETATKHETFTTNASDTPAFDEYQHNPFFTFWLKKGLYTMANHCLGLS